MEFNRFEMSTEHGLKRELDTMDATSFVSAFHPMLSTFDTVCRLCESGKLTEADRRVKHVASLFGCSVLSYEAIVLSGA